MENNKQEQKLKDLQLTLEKLDQINKLSKHKEEHKIKLDNGLYINTKIINDIRNIEDFNSKYQRDLVLFNLENIGKTEQDFIERKIREIDLKETDKERMWNLSDEDFFQEFRKDDETKNKTNWNIDEAENKKQILRNYRNSFKPSEFEDYRLTLYKQKQSSLPKTKNTTDKPLKTNTNQYSEIFSNNGYELFNYILENHIKQKGKRGRYADLSFYYWSLYSSTEKYIHQRPEVFKNWFCEKYIDSFEKIKTIREVNDANGNRKKHYQTSLDWFKNEFNTIQ